MNKLLGISMGILSLATVPGKAQQVASVLPSAPQPHPQATLAYTPPTQSQRLKDFVTRTFSVGSLLEASIRGGIGQARDTPSEWPQGAEGFGERMGSAAGEIAIRDTTEFLVADMLREDIRRSHGEAQSAFSAAFQDTFTARKGEDGHRVFSLARLAGPVAAGTIARETWYPGSASGKDVLGEIGINYGFSFVRNFIRDAIRK
jgi:hypothetical protein